MSLGNIMSIIGGLASVFGVGGVIFKVITNSEQSNLSLSMLSHSARVRYRWTLKLVIFIAVFFSLFCIGYDINSRNDINTEISELRQEATSLDNEEKNSEDKLSDLEKTIKDKKTQALNKETPINIYSKEAKIFFWVFVLSLIAQVFIDNTFTSLYQKRGKHPFKSWFILILIRGIVFVVAFGDYALAKLLPGEYYYFIDALCALMMGIMVNLAISYYFRQYDEDHAYTKFEKTVVSDNDEAVYIFGMKEDYLIVGDSKFEYDCTKHYLVKVEGAVSDTAIINANTPNETLSIKASNISFLTAAGLIRYCAEQYNDTALCDTRKIVERVVYDSLIKHPKRICLMHVKYDIRIQDGAVSYWSYYLCNNKAATPISNEDVTLEKTLVIV